MTPLRFTQPCNDCPFRRNAIKGWLGGAPPEWFVESALADYADYSNDANAAPCHQTVDYDDPDWINTQAKDAAVCAGALIFARNLCKQPRDPARAEMVQAVEQNKIGVFDNSQDFIDHHRDPEGMLSWES